MRGVKFKQVFNRGRIRRLIARGISKNRAQSLWVFRVSLPLLPTPKILTFCVLRTVYHSPKFLQFILLLSLALSASLSLFISPLPSFRSICVNHSPPSIFLYLFTFLSFSRDFVFFSIFFYAFYFFFYSSFRNLNFIVSVRF